ncbi:hypothetical protein F4823DRAFT_569205 [Ustulina deusta]|nr:hypothetical protein F4823DRAFT_569205 [Ustulina deusta]
MDRLGRSKALPSSPWADRFPIGDCTFISENTNHSLLAPECPRINDPKYYDQDPIFTNAHPQSYEDIDKLLWSEKTQREKLFGLQTWQVAALHRYLRFSPDTGFLSGGHRPADARMTGLPFAHISTLRPSLPLPGLRAWPADMGTNEERNFRVYQRERIKVDETPWFPFLRKDRWFDWTHVSPDFTQPPGRTWSVDDPKVWEVLSIILELVNRILQALIRDKHEGDYWENYVDQLGSPPSANATVLLSYPTEQKISHNRGEPFCVWDFIVTKTSKEWSDRLITLLSSLVWTFQELGSVEAITYPLPEFDGRHWPYTAIILLNLRNFETMLKPNLALGELCTMQVNSAITVVHELMHAILQARYLNDDYVGNLLDYKRTGNTAAEEPFLDGEGIAEAGHYMEQLFFGGCEIRYPLSSSQNDNNTLPLTSTFTEWPWAWSGQRTAPTGAFLQDGHIGRAYHIPLTWISKMLSESFWQDPAFPNKSERFFHRNTIFMIEYEITDRSAKKIKPKIQDLRSLPYSYPEDAKVREAWDERSELWENYRAPWYDRVNEEWEGSPWSSLFKRRTLYEFMDAFSKKDLLTCYKAGTTLARQTRDSRPSRFIQHKHSSYWMWYVIGLLMLASIPIHHKNLERVPSSVHWTTEVAPSREAAAAGHAHIVHVNPDNGIMEGHVSISRRKFYNQIRYQGRQITNYTQLDYLELIDDVIELITSLDAVVHVNFLDAINTAKQALLADRQDMVAKYGVAHVSRWASDWFFNIPAYNPTTCSFVDGKWTPQPPISVWGNNHESCEVRM